MAYGDFRDLARKTAFDKILRDKAFNITKNPKYDGFQRRLAFMLNKFLDKKSAGSGVNMYASNKIKQNQCHLAMHQLAEELNQLLKSLKKEQFILDSKIIFGVLI